MPPWPLATGCIWISGFSAYALTDLRRIIGNVTGTSSLASSECIADCSGRRAFSRVQDPNGSNAWDAHSLEASIQQSVFRWESYWLLAGQTVNVPVSITDNAAGVASADFAFDYNPALLTLTNAGVTLGTALSNSGWSMITNVDSADEVAFVSLFAASRAASRHAATGQPGIHRGCQCSLSLIHAGCHRPC